MIVIYDDDGGDDDDDDDIGLLGSFGVTSGELDLGSDFKWLDGWIRSMMATVWHVVL